jgi:hypothetical protein
MPDSESTHTAMPTPRPICTVGGILRGLVGCIASAAASLVVEGDDSWSATECVVGWTKTVANTVIVAVAVAECVGMPVLSEMSVVDAELAVITLGMGDA